jgi:hypothetical protein
MYLLQDTHLRQTAKYALRHIDTAVSTFHLAKVQDHLKELPFLSYPRTC